MELRITIRHVAEEAGVHFTTAARALKNDPRISPETRQRVQVAARKLGYMTDPMMAAFSAYRQKHRVASFHGTLAWVTNYPEPDGWRNAASDLYHAGANERARELGYKLEEFWLRQPGMTSRRAGSILLNRGIRGILLCPQPKARSHLSIHWEDFSVVAFGYSMVRPKVHLVSTAHYRSMITSVRKLRGLGYKRIGFACWRSMDERSDRLWTAAWLAQMQGVPEAKVVPIFFYDHNPRESPNLQDEESFFAWHARYQPDAIITTLPEEGPLHWLLKRGFEVPGDIGVAILGLQQKDGYHAGIDERSNLIGRAAVDLVWRMLQHGERGISEAPIRILIEGAWIDGETVARKTSSERS